MSSKVHVQRKGPRRGSRPHRRRWRRFADALLVVGVLCLAIPATLGQFFADPSLPRAPLVDGELAADIVPANEGAFAGGATGTHADAGVNNALPESALTSANTPTGGRPSPLFGAQPFTQKFLRFEEFGRRPLPSSFAPAAPASFPTVADAQSCPDGAAIDELLASPIWPQPQVASNTSHGNPWKGRIEAQLGRACDYMPAEGRPPGGSWTHQRWDEFPPQVYFESAMTGARTNGGLRDPEQLHGYAVGEFAPGGLYHNTAGVSGFEGTAEGIGIRFHPNMPLQDPLALWTFDGTLPPKLLMARYGEPILFRHYNCLPIDPAANLGFGLHTITTHEHNGHNPGESDGYTNAFFFPGQYYDYHWPLVLAGHDTINTTASDPRAGTPDGNGGITMIPGDYRETMSTHWFHDHMLDFTAQNVYKGNAAMMNYYSAIDRGNEAIDDGVNLRFPSGTALDWGNRDYDVNVLVADKAWDSDGQLWFNIFNLDGFIGDQVVTNWLYKPTMDVRARRYRLRILNGSVSRYFKIALVDEAGNPVPFHLIANDGNIMEHAVAFDGTLGTQTGILPTQSIAERYDIIVDFGQFEPGDRLYLVNLLEHTDGKAPNQVVDLQDVLSGAYQAQALDDDGDGVLDRWVDGDPCVGKFLEFVVQPYDGTDLSMDPQDYIRGGQTMIPLHRASEEELANAVHRTFTFGRSSGTDSAPWTIKSDGGAGLTADPRRISAAPQRDSLEVWHIENGGGGWSHPVHVHFEEGIILKRDGQDPPEWETWARKDMYRIGPLPESGDSVEMQIRFREFAGTYVEHCHNTQHEDHAMLLRWDIENPGQLNVMPAPMPTWEGVEYVDTVALPTYRTGDGTGTSFQPGGLGPAVPDPTPILALDPTAPPPAAPAADTLTVTRAEFDAGNGEWRVEGDSTATGHTVDIWLGDPATGTLIATVTVSGSQFEYRDVGADATASGAPGFVTISSSLGGSTTAAIEIR